MATKKEVAKANTTSVSAGGYDYGDDAGAGFENKTASDLSIPFINLLQSNSPEVQNSKDGSVRIGMMKNTVTGEIFNGEKGFYFQPVHDDMAFVEWVPRTKGGGYVGVHDQNSDEVLEAIKANGGSRIPKKGSDGKKIPLMVGTNELVETYYLYGLILDEDGETTRGFAVIPFTSTKIKVYRDFVTAMMMIRGKPPMLAFRVKISSDIQQNDSGTFANYIITPMVDNSWVESLIDPSSDLYSEGKEFRKMVTSGMARADFSQQQSDGVSGAGGSGAANSDDEAPF